MGVIDQAFRVETGLSLEDYNGVFPVQADPSAEPGLDVPKGSLALYLPASGNGGVYIKYGSLATNWTKVSVGGGQPRYVNNCGYNGVANAPRFMQFFAGVSSDTSPYVVAETSAIKAISVSVQFITTATFELYKNVTTYLNSITLAGEKIKYVTGLDCYLDIGESISVKLASGSAQNIIFSTFIQVVE